MAGDEASKRSIYGRGGTKDEAHPANRLGAAQRALAEAAARLADRERGAETPKELNGRGGLDPVRFGDWEVNGIASDF